MKKIITWVCLIAMVMSFGVAAFASADFRGDVNADGEITLNDAMDIIMVCAKKTDIKDVAEPLAADIDQDYSVTLNDAMWIINIVAKKAAEFPEFDKTFDYDKLAEILGVKVA